MGVASESEPRKLMPMYVQCGKCRRNYDDAVSWTLCPHGPLWAGPTAYCPKHDLVNCFICEEENMHPSVAHVLKFFKYDHLTPALQEISRPFAELANQVAERGKEGNPETTVCLRKLLEAKDAAVRAVLP